MDRQVRSQGRDVHTKIAREGGKILEEEGELAAMPSKGWGGKRIGYERGHSFGAETPGR